MSSYLFAGGGTAGHVNPMLATAERLRDLEPDSTFTILGTKEGLEAKLVPERGFQLEMISKVTMPRRIGSATFSFPFRLAKAVRQTRQLIRTSGVDLVIGFGGFVSAPAYLAGWLEKKPIVVHEANAIPGFANRLGSKLSKFVGVTFAGTKLAHAQLVGMPMRKEIEQLDRKKLRPLALKEFGFANDLPTLIVTGGSLGAQTINKTVSETVSSITNLGWNVLHIVGMKAELPETTSPRYRPRAYCDRMDLAFAVADLAVSRAGSATVSELSGLGIPAVLVPYESGNGEQTQNAKSVVDAGGALLVRNSDFNPNWIKTVFLALLNAPKTIEEMATAAKSVGRLDGTERLIALIREALGKGR